MQYGLDVNVLYALVKKLPETGSVEDKSSSGRPKNKTMTLDRILVQTSLADVHLTSLDTGSSAAVQPRNHAAFRRHLAVLQDPDTAVVSFQRSSLFPGCQVAINKTGLNINMVQLRCHLRWPTISRLVLN